MRALPARTLTATGAALGALLFACARVEAQIPQAPASASPAEDGNWRMPARDLASTRYSALDQINTA
ncbi:MAG TPA: hypothetical protein VGQ27_16535, partial [Steroidobacteraceae bacterium]|nr:hypothetical protein [Steroidobacteraceae bacterium]